MKRTFSCLIFLLSSFVSLVGHAQSSQVPTLNSQSATKPAIQGTTKSAGQGTARSTGQGTLKVPAQATAKLPVEPKPAVAPDSSVIPVVVAPPIVRELTGTVLSESGTPVAGATVVIVGEKSQSTSTNSAGAYVLHSASTSPVLHVSYAGYEDDEQTMRGAEPLTFNLVPIEGYKRQLKKQSKAANKAYRK
jgi:hypothetical protein